MHHPGARRRGARTMCALLLPVALLLSACAFIPPVVAEPGPGGAETSGPIAAATDIPAPILTSSPAPFGEPVPSDGIASDDPWPLAPTPPAPPFDPLRPGCAQSTTMSVWAHYDDDLLFLGGEIAAAIAAGDCVRTVFLTGGDAGKGREYEAGRERGILRAYDVMRGAEDPWVSTTTVLSTGASVTLSSPQGDPDITLVFLRLPDGNLNGQGYPGTGEVSLAKLAAERIADIPDLAGSFRLTWDALITSVGELITGFSPTTFFTHMPGSITEWAKGDHADHAITGIIARAAWRAAAIPDSSASYAMGYQISSHPANVTGDALTRKIAAFRAYAQDDSVTAGCRDDASCLAMPRFGAWLQRQYIKTEAEISAR